LAWRRLVATALIAASALAVAGCTKDDHDLPSLGGTRGAASGSLEDIAKKYYDCMSADGLPVTIVGNSKGEMAVVQLDSQEHTILQRDDTGAGMASFGGREPTEAELKEQEDFFGQVDGGIALRVDGIDHSETYARCLKESGYNDQEAWGPYQADPEHMQRQVTASNQWAACARENGWPDIKDSVMPTKMDGSEWPTVTVPSTITEDQLRQLLAACPNFDPDKQKKLDEWYQNNPTATSVPDEYLPEPSIQIGADNVYEGHGQDWTPGPQEQAELDRIGRLTEILYQAANQYYQSQSAGSMGGAVASEAVAGG
jgi:hypothetical protein